VHTEKRNYNLIYSTKNWASIRFTWLQTRTKLTSSLPSFALSTLRFIIMNVSPLELCTYTYIIIIIINCNLFVQSVSQQLLLFSGAVDDEVARRIVLPSFSARPVSGTKGEQLASRAMSLTWQYVDFECIHIARQGHSRHVRRSRF
jgi:hypothetical protein